MDAEGRLRQEAALVRRRLRLRGTDETLLRRRAAAAMTGTRPRPHRRVLGSVWLIAVVRDEADVIEEFVTHHLGQGLDRLLVADNGSQDGTDSMLEALARSDARITLLDDRARGFHQGAKLTHLAHLAWRAGADWVVPADADERWVGATDTVPATLADARRQGLDIVTAHVHNAYPTSDVRDAPWTWDPHPHPITKVAFRTHPFAEVADGAHWVRRPGSRGDGLHFLHLPWRSRTRLAEKIRKGSAGLSAAGLGGPASGVDGHWGEMTGLSSGELDAVWAEICGGPDAGLEFGYKPHGALVPLASTSPSTWNDVEASAPGPEEAR